MKVKRSRLLVLALLLPCPWGCETNETVHPEQTVSDRITGEVLINTGLVVAIKNGIGPVVVDWGGVENKVRWFMNRQVTGDDVNEVRAQLNLIEFFYQTDGDTLEFMSRYPLDMSRFRYEALLSLGIPYTMPCVVDSVEGTTTISYLGGSVVVRNARGLTVNDFNGSCDVEALEGQNTLEVALPDSGHCVLIAVTGDILLTIPALTSAAVSARSLNGSVSYSNLSINSLVQRPDSLSGTLATGNGEIRLHTGQGNVVIQGSD